MILSRSINLLGIYFSWTNKPYRWECKTHVGFSDGLSFCLLRPSLALGVRARFLWGCCLSVLSTKEEITNDVNCLQDVLYCLVFIMPLSLHFSFVVSKDYRELFLLDHYPYFIILSHTASDQTKHKMTSAKENFNQTSASQLGEILPPAPQTPRRHLVMCGNIFDYPDWRKEVLPLESNAQRIRMLLNIPQWMGRGTPTFLPPQSSIQPKCQYSHS